MVDAIIQFLPLILSSPKYVVAYLWEIYLDSRSFEGRQNICLVLLFRSCRQGWKINIEQSFTDLY